MQMPRRERDHCGETLAEYRKNSEVSRECRMIVALLR